MSGWTALFTMGVSALLGFAIAAVSCAATISDYRLRIDGLRRALTIIAKFGDDPSRESARAVLELDERMGRGS